MLSDARWRSGRAVCGRATRHTAASRARARPARIAMTSESRFAPRVERARDDAAPSTADDRRAPRGRTRDDGRRRRRMGRRRAGRDARKTTRVDGWERERRARDDRFDEGSMRRTISKRICQTREARTRTRTASRRARERWDDTEAREGSYRRRGVSRRNDSGRRCDSKARCRTGFLSGSRR